MRFHYVANDTLAFYSYGDANKMACRLHPLILVCRAITIIACTIFTIRRQRQEFVSIVILTTAIIWHQTRAIWRQCFFD